MFIRDRSKLKAFAYDVIDNILSAGDTEFRLQNPIYRVIKPITVHDFRRIDPTCAYPEQNTDVWLFNYEETTPKVLWPIDVCIYTPAGKSGNP